MAPCAMHDREPLVQTDRVGLPRLASMHMHTHMHTHSLARRHRVQSRGHDERHSRGMSACIDFASVVLPTTTSF